MTEVERMLDELRLATRATRVTLRLESSDAPFPVVAESLAAETPSLQADSRVDPTATATFKHVEQSRELLIQTDCSTAEPYPGSALIDLYGVRAQMLAPVERDGRLCGVISVHDTKAPHDWSAGDISALGSTAARIRDLLD